MKISHLHNRMYLKGEQTFESSRENLCRLIQLNAKIFICHCQNNTI